MPGYRVVQSFESQILEDLSLDAVHSQCILVAASAARAQYVQPCSVIAVATHAEASCDPMDCDIGTVAAEQLRYLESASKQVRVNLGIFPFSGLTRWAASCLSLLVSCNPRFFTHCSSDVYYYIIRVMGHTASVYCTVILIQAACPGTYGEPASDGQAKI